MDMGDIDSLDPADLEKGLFTRVDEQARRFEVNLVSSSPSEALRELIVGLAEQGQKVVILVDEYDKPFLNHLGTETAQVVQRVLKSFYAVIKTTEYAQRFVLLTGVSKFSQVSVFSDLNNLTDLTMDRRVATLLGYTQAELEANFPDYIEALAKEHGTDTAGILPEIRDWYNGYRFEEDAQTVYNPVSVMKCFQNRKFKNYWFETGTPSFLVRVLKNNPIDVDEPRLPEAGLAQFDPSRLEPLALLLQTGYLTIIRTEKFGDSTDYILGYPNREVERSFNMSLATGFAESQINRVHGQTRHMVRSLNEGDLEWFFEEFRTFLSGVPYDIIDQKEQYYQTLFYAALKLMGVAVDVEVRTNRGRVDAVVKTTDRIYIFEFKLRGTAEDALQQIRDKGYAEPYRNDKREVLCIGAAFDEETRNLGQWLMEKAKFTTDKDDKY
jgi:hypothetical protein